MSRFCMTCLAFWSCKIKNNISDMSSNELKKEEWRPVKGYEGLYDDGQAVEDGKEIVL